MPLRSNVGPLETSKTKDVDLQAQAFTTKLIKHKGLRALGLAYTVLWH